MSLRFGIVGLGNIGKIHLENLASGKVPGAVATAVCNRSRPSGALPAGVLYFSSVQEMLDSGVVDAVVVSTPHLDHLRTGEAVLRHGLHLMMEKPITATKLEGERLLAVPRRQGQKFAMMLNVRTNPHFQKIKSLIDDGELGDLQRVQWTITNWFRPEAYYASTAWRATWKEDGGGVLLNQALHNLDILQWLCGLPKQLRAFCRFGSEHEIEVEDSVVAYLEYDGGMTGIFTTSTGEAPGVNRLEIAGTRGLAIWEKGRLLLTRNKEDTREYSRTTDNAFGMPVSTTEELPAADVGAGHAAVLANFVEAIRYDAPLLADGTEGLKSLELANAMLLSTWRDAPVSLPLDSADFQEAFEEAVASSRPKTGPVRTVKVDMGKSYS